MNGKDTVSVYTKDSILFTRNILSALRPGESFQVWYYLSGCFGSHGNKLEISRSSGSYTAKLFNWDRSAKESFLGIYRSGSLIKAVTLDTAKLRAFADFELKWPELHQTGLCTTVENYTFFTRHLNSTITCGYDMNNSFEKLIANFFHN